MAGLKSKTESESPTVGVRRGAVLLRPKTGSAVDFEGAARLRPYEEFASIYLIDRLGRRGPVTKVRISWPYGMALF